MQKEKRLKILFLPSWYPSEKNPANGIFIQEQAKAVSLYNEVIVLYNEGWNKNLKKAWETVSDKTKGRIRTIRIKSKKYSIPKTDYLVYFWSIEQAFKKLLKEEWKPDIIHVHVYPAGIPAVIIEKKYKIPVVITEHWTYFPLRLLKKTDVLQARFAMNRAKIILPVSNDLEKAIKSYGIKNQFKVIPNVVDTKTFYPSLNQWDNNKKKILFVGFIIHRKGISYLLEAVAQLKQKRQDFVLDIVGNGANGKEYEGLTEQLGLSKMVKFHGLKMKEQVADFMRNCDFFVQPSLCETFGVTYIEAMACGKPIVATQIPTLQEKINKDRGILVPPKDVDALSKAIDYMLDHCQNYSAEKISQYAKDNFSYEVVGKKLNDVYKEVIKSL